MVFSFVFGENLKSHVTGDTSKSFDARQVDNFHSKNPSPSQYVVNQRSTVYQHCGPDSAFQH